MRSSGITFFTLPQTEKPGGAYFHDAVYYTIHAQTSE